MLAVRSCYFLIMENVPFEDVDLCIGVVGALVDGIAQIDLGWASPCSEGNGLGDDA